MKEFNIIAVLVQVAGITLTVYFFSKIPWVRNRRKKIDEMKKWDKLRKK